MDILCGSASNHLFLDDVVSHSCHQSEPVTGTGAFRSFPPVGNYQEGDRSQHPFPDHSSRSENHVLWGVVSSLLCLVINTFYTGKLIQVGFIMQMRDLFPTLVVSLLMFVLVLSLQWMTENLYAQLLGGIILGSGFYLAVTRILRFQELQELFSLFSKR